MLSKTERKFLEGKIDVNVGYRNKLRHSIKMKIVQLRKDLELLLDPRNREFVDVFKRRYIYEEKEHPHYNQYMDLTGENPILPNELNQLQKFLNKFEFDCWSGIVGPTQED